MVVLVFMYQPQTSYRKQKEKRVKREISGKEGEETFFVQPTLTLILTLIKNEDHKLQKKITQSTMCIAKHMTVMRYKNKCILDPHCILSPYFKALHGLGP